MKKPSPTIAAVMLLPAAVLLLCEPARAEFGIGINLGNLGFGVEARQTLSPSLGVRVGIAGLKYSSSFEYDDIDYDIDQSLAVPEVKLDWRPGQGSFRMTVGASYYNEVSNIELTPEPGSVYTIGNTTYNAADIGTLRGKLSYHVGAPYLGVGWDFRPRQKNIGFTVDLGAYYRNRPDVSLSTTGTVTPSDLSLERSNIEGDAWTFVPTLKLGMLFRF